VEHERRFEGLKDQLQEVTDDLRSLNAQRDQQTSELTQTLEVVDKLRQQMAEAVSAAEDAVRASSGDGAAAAAAAAAAGGSADMDPEDWMAKSETTLRNVVLRRRARNALGTATH
jgi:chromosome segregation ATPase